MKTPAYLKQDEWSAEQKNKHDFYVGRIWALAVCVTIVLFAVVVTIYV
ncbi:hypothetical protein KAR91_02750 [Candidatus Pacearchaeota archaeon]|nr:hypothetical protein [Candidatus Pacearchaeota archaeon]